MKTRVKVKSLGATLLAAALAVGCAATTDRREAAGAGGGGGTGTAGAGGTSGSTAGGSGTAGTGVASGASGSAAAGGAGAASGSGGSGTVDVCSGYPDNCFPLCEGGLCDCYCPVAGGTGGENAGAGGTVGTAGSGGAGGTAGTTAGDGATGGAGGTGGAGDACTEDCTRSGFVCCNGSCVNTGNDILNCGSCGNQCSGATPYCNGTCTSPPCFAPGTCDSGVTCCGSSCCGAGQICCEVNIGPSVLQCTDPVDGTCPRGCPMCVCADPDTAVATPEGERRIADIAVGDLVYSIEAESIVVVPVRRIQRTPVNDHQVVRIDLETGRTLELSARHPTAEGRAVGDLSAGDSLGGVSVTATETIPYEHEFTYDILPDSESGVYFASDVPIGSTLR